MDVKQTHGDRRRARWGAWAAALLSVLPAMAQAAGQSPGDTFRDCPGCPEAGGGAVGALHDGLAVWRRR